MALTRNKQLAMYVMLCTRSAYRAMLEKWAVVGGKPQPTSVVDQADLRTRLTTVQPPNGMTFAELTAWTSNSVGPWTGLYVQGSSSPHIAQISTDPAVIAVALEMAYVPTNPDCPTYNEGNIISSLLAANLPTIKMASRHPKVKYAATGGAPKKKAAAR